MDVRIVSVSLLVCILCGCTGGAVQEDGVSTADVEIIAPASIDELPVQDGCPDDPLKTTPGECGCGQPDFDSDKDGLYNCYDGFPNEPSSPGTHTVDMHLFMQGVSSTANKQWHKKGVTQCFPQPADSAWEAKAEAVWGCAGKTPGEREEGSAFFKNYVRQNPSTTASESVHLIGGSGRAFEIYRLSDSAIYLDVESSPQRLRLFNQGPVSFKWSNRFVTGIYDSLHSYTIVKTEPCGSVPIEQTPIGIDRLVGPYNLSTGTGRAQAIAQLNSSAEQKNISIPSAWYTSIPKTLGYSGNVWLVTREVFWAPFTVGVYAHGTNPNDYYAYEENYDYLCVGIAADACRSVGIVGWRVKYRPNATAPLKLIKLTAANKVVFETTPIIMNSESCYTGP